MTEKTRIRLSRDEKYTAQITELAPGGKGVGRIDGKVVFVEKAVPGQTVSLQVFKDKRDHAEARILDVIEQSDDYAEPRCPHFLFCGGCAIQNIAYERQLSYKREWVNETLRRIGGMTDIPVNPVIPSPDIYFYRNKMEFSFSSKVFDEETRTIKSAGAGLGMHLPGRFDTVVNIGECYLQSEETVRILEIVRRYAADSGLAAYDTRKHAGFWRYLIVREGKLTGERLVALVTNETDESGKELIERIARDVAEKTGGVTAFLHAAYGGKSSSAVLDNLRVVAGRDYIEDSIGEYTFRIEAGTFFQTNTRQVKYLYDEVLKAAECTGGETVYDLFSGIGTIPVYLSGHVKNVLGIELSEESVAAAKRNAENNGAGNCRFLAGKVRSAIKYPAPLFAEYGRPGVVIVDPPRSGLDPKTVDRIAKLGAPRIVYVSCNPATLARDLAQIADTYGVHSVTPVDMFPHTAHIESVVRLDRVRRDQ